MCERDRRSREGRNHAAYILELLHEHRPPPALEVRGRDLPEVHLIPRDVLHIGNDVLGHDEERQLLGAVGDGGPCGVEVEEGDDGARVITRPLQREGGGELKKRE